jgi:hypothetical protein
MLNLQFFDFVFFLCEVLYKQFFVIFHKKIKLFLNIFINYNHFFFKIYQNVR